MKKLSDKDKIYAYWSGSFLISWTYAYLIMPQEDQILMARSFYGFAVLSVDVLISTIVLLLIPSSISWGFSNPRTLLNRSKNTLIWTAILCSISYYGYTRFPL